MTPWEKRARAEIGAGNRVMAAELCRKCSGVVPLKDERFRGWSDIKTCACGITTSSAVVGAALFDDDLADFNPGAPESLRVIA